PAARRQARRAGGAAHRRGARPALPHAGPLRAGHASLPLSARFGEPGASATGGAPDGLPPVADAPGSPKSRLRVVDEGIEPPFSVRQTDVLPLDESTSDSTPGGSRTHNLRRIRASSYRCSTGAALPTGVEPAISGLTNRRPLHLAH